MNRLLPLVMCFFALAAQAQDPRVWLATSQGPIIVELDPGAAPVTVENFLRYVDDGFYDGLVFHRVAEGFVVQGGGFDTDRRFREPTFAPIVNEADNGLSNLSGTIAMARTNVPDSATSQFFINLEDNTDLDPGGLTEAGYAVFGEVVFGSSVLDAMAALNVINAQGNALHEWPFDPPVIHRAARTDSFPLMSDHSGSWFDENNGGVGFNIEIANDASGNGPLAIVYWYNFADGKQFWLTGQAGFDWGADEVTVDLFSAESGSFLSAESEFGIVGTLTLGFDSCTTGAFAYDMPDYGSGEITVTRLSRPDGFRCASE